MTPTRIASAILRSYARDAVNWIVGAFVLVTAIARQRYDELHAVQVARAVEREEALRRAVDPPVHDPLELDAEERALFPAVVLKTPPRLFCAECALDREPCKRCRVEA